MSVNKVKTNVCVDLTVEGKVYSLHEGDAIDNIDYVEEGIAKSVSGKLESFKIVATRFYRHHRHTDDSFTPSIYFNKLVGVIGMNILQDNGKKVTVNMEDVVGIGYKSIFPEDAVVVEVATVEELVTAFTAGGNVKLTAPVDMGVETVSIPKDVEVVLDLNGQTISGVMTETVTANHTLIQNNGSLVIDDSTGKGKITYSYTGETTNWGKSTNTITNAPKAKLVVNGGTIENTTNVPSHIYYAIDNLTNGNTGIVELEINGGEISCPNYRAIRMFCNSTTDLNKVTINGGKISSETNAPVVLHISSNKAHVAELNITGGEISTVSDGSNRAVYVTGFGGVNEDTVSNVSINISGGYYKGAIVVDPDEFAEGLLTGFVTGGHYTVDPSTYVAEGHSVEESKIKGYNYHVI